MSSQSEDNKKSVNKITGFSYAMATMHLTAALAGVAYSIYALIVLQKTVFSYITIVISGLFTIVSIL